MNYQEKKPAKIIYLPAIALFLFITTVAAAQNNTFTARLNIRGEHNDNIRLESINPRDDLFTTIGPSLSFRRSTEKMSLTSKAAVDVIRYSEESDENRENQDYSLNSDFALSERVRLTGDLQYRDDMTLQGELLETGEVSSWQSRKQMTGGGGITWGVTELSSIALNYSYLKKEFEEASSVDYDQHSTSLSFYRYMNDGLDSIELSPVYEFQDSDYSRLDSYSLSLGWRHAFSETFFMSVSAGGRYNTEEQFNEVVDSTGWIAKLSIQRETETATTIFGYNRDLYTNVGGGQTEVDQFFLNLNKRILPRLRVGVEGRVYFRQQPGGSLNRDETNGRDETYYQVSPTLSFMLTEKQSVELGYRYSCRDNNSASNEGTTDSNAVWLVIKLMYDKRY